MISNTQSFWIDLKEGCSQPRLVRLLAWRSLAKTYDRTSIGIWWIPLDVLFHFLTIGLVLSLVLGGDGRYLPYFAPSFALWRIFTQSTIRGADLWNRSENLLRNFPLPKSLFLLQECGRSFYLFLLKFPVAIIIALTTGAFLTINIFFLPFGAILFLLNLSWIIVLFSLIGGRFPDFHRFLPSVMYALYIGSPILWQPERLGDKYQFVAQLNPIFHLMEVVRRPILGESPTTLSWSVVIILALAGWLVTFQALVRTHKEIVLWL
jgi:ABC-type polysaccharide/polyol phosphate export permease